MMHDSVYISLLYFIWNKEQLPEEWKDSIIVPIYKKGEERDCSNYRDISILPTTYKILSKILLSRLTSYAEGNIGDHQCGFIRNRSILIVYSTFVKYSRKNWITT